MLALVEGKRPSRPTHPTFTDNLWVLMQRCWHQDLHLRPEVSEALEFFPTPSSGMDRVVGTRVSCRSNDKTSNSSMFFIFHLMFQTNL